MFEHLVHADWGIAPGKRWHAHAERSAEGWHVGVPVPVPASGDFLDRLFEAAAARSVLAGFDFPIGLPQAYAVRSGTPDFRSALSRFGAGEWQDFYRVAAVPEEISLRRPFYPLAAAPGTSRASLVTGLGVARFDELLRVCERRTATRAAACALFWTLGPNQVGKGAIAGWREVVRPALDRGASLWPFDGSLAALASRRGLVMAEAYPAEACSIVGASFRRTQSKRRPSDRRAKAKDILQWAQPRRIDFSPDARLALLAGFGEDRAGEDRFDAFVGLLGMIEVVDGRWPEACEQHPDVRPWEGWILGR